MLKAVLDLFTGSNQPDNNRDHSVELATAALICELINADNQTDRREKQAYRDVLKSQFTLDDDTLNTLVSDGQETADNAVDLVQFTKIINEQCDNEQKKSILTGLWKVAYADEQLAPIEENVIRRIADLLYIPHSQFIKTKLSVTGEPD